MLIGILGDLHGHIYLALKLLQRWQQENAIKLDYILQVGDFGVWSYPFYKLDKETLKFSKKDPEEISFPQYLEDTEEARYFFANYDEKNARIEADLIFIKGNHEDFEYLNMLANRKFNSLIAVDYYHKIKFLPNGRYATLSKSNQQIIVAGLGGLENGRYGAGFTKKEVKNILSAGKIDILLAHEPYKGAINEFIGSEELKMLIDYVKPAYFFCGHLHEEGRQLFSNNNTKSYILNEVNFRKRNELNKNCIGILKWNCREDSSFAFLNDSWVMEYTRDNYK